ncbi:MAG TPA: glycosyl hydrolase [Solirubrobacterales bacterium]|nr:glycosyl hydrolase [Solirubrobacterales bacterium]
MVQGGIAKAAAICLCALGLLAAATSAGAATYFGATIGGETYGYGPNENPPLNEAAWNLFERHAGKRVAILNQGQNWGSFEGKMMDATVAHGAIPLVTMGLGKEMTLEDVTDGSQDATIEKWAKAAKAWGHPFLFAPWWEMNGNWYAWGRSPDFIAAWRHFHDLVVAQGATNVTWTWDVNSIWSDPESKELGKYYPGDEYVDWLGLDSYNWGRNPVQPDRWTTPEQTLSPTLKILGEVAPGKPVAIVEDASTEYGGNKADWIREMLTSYLPHHPEIKAYLWFEWNFPKNAGREDWPIESSAPAQQQFRQAIQSSLFAPAPASLPALTKVPPPGAASGGPTEAADLSPPGEVVGGSDVAVAADGTATVVWSARQGGGTFQVFARRIAPDGTPERAQQLSAPGQDALDPQVAVAPDGTATVAWTRSDGSSFLVQARRISPDGTPEESTKNLSTTGQSSYEPQLAVAPDGTATVVWKRFDGAHYLVQERRIAGDGTREETFHTLSEPKQDAAEPQVGVAEDDTATVVWSRFDGSDSIVQARQIAPSGEPGASTASLSAVGESAIQPRVAVAAEGAATVVWNRFDGADWIVQAQRLSAAGLPTGGTENLSAAGQSAAEPQIAAEASGKATVAWDRFDGSSFVVQARQLDAEGEPLGPALDLSAAGRDAAEPALAIAPGAAATALWARSDGTNFVVQRRDLESDGSLTGTESLSAPGHSAGYPALAWGSDGVLAMSWSRGNGAADVVQAKTVPLPPPPPPPPGEEGGGSGGPSSGKTVPGSAAQAVDNSFRLGRPRYNRRLGTATLAVTVPGPGEVSLAGAVPRRLSTAGAETVGLRIVPRRAQRLALRRRGSLRLRVSVSFAPAGGTAASRVVRLRLRRTSGS